MTVKQVSIFLENKPGHLEEPLQVLRDADINIIALTIAEASGYGLLRLIVDKPRQAVEALNKANITCSETPVLAVEIDDTPGALLEALEGFKERNLNIEYLYTFAEKQRRDRIVVIFRFEDVEAARKIIEDDGFPVLRHEDIIGA